MTCPECGSDDLAIGPYDEGCDHLVCNTCFHSWLAPKVDPWDAKCAAIEEECDRHIAQAKHAVSGLDEWRRRGTPGRFGLAPF